MDPDPQNENHYSDPYPDPVSDPDPVLDPDLSLN